MKRGRPLRRRKPLQRSEWRRSERDRVGQRDDQQQHEDRREQHVGERDGHARRDTPLRRKRRLSPISKRRAAENAANRQLVVLVFKRDNYLCIPKLRGAPGECFGRLSPHHLRKQSQGGTWTLDNLVTSCTFHNDWIEDNPAVAYALGLVRRRADP